MWLRSMSSSLKFRFIRELHISTIFRSVDSFSFKRTLKNITEPRLPYYCSLSNSDETVSICLFISVIALYCLEHFTLSVSIVSFLSDIDFFRISISLDCSLSELIIGAFSSALTLCIVLSTVVATQETMVSWMNGFSIPARVGAS